MGSQGCKGNWKQKDEPADLKTDLPVSCVGGTWIVTQADRCQTTQTHRLRQYAKRFGKRRVELVETL
jgi:hypothetical protein